MAAPDLLVEFTTDDPNDTTPTWVDVTADVRSFSSSRGRGSELDRVEAGTARILLDNRTRSYDPTSDATIRPLNRWRISMVMDGPVTEEIFVGYAESYEQQWPAHGKDAVTVVSLVDEFRVLALDRLLNTNPPRDTYADVVAFDAPHAHWRFGPTGAGEVRAMEPAIGNGTFVGSHFGSFAGEPSPIIGDYHAQEFTNEIRYANARETTGGFPIVDFSTYLSTGTLGMGPTDPGNAGGLSSFTFELWFKSSEATPAAQRIIAVGPLSSGSFQWSLTHETNGKVRAVARNSGGTAFTHDSASAISASTWYHLALVVSGSATTLYVNGVAQATPASFSGVFGAMDAGAKTQIGPGSAVGGTRYFDEPAIYRAALAVDRLLAHYEAGALLAFPEQDPGVRIEAVLDAAGNVAARNVQTGTREMTPAYMAGRAPLELLREAEAADNVDAVLFIARDGTITFLADGHRSAAPYDTVQATFDDDGTDLPYQNVDVDYSEAFLFNEVTLSRTGGELTTESDATSITAYYKRSLSLTELPITTEADQDAIAVALLAKYKDPLFRITALDLLGTEEVAEAVLPLDIGHRIRVFRTQLTGGRIDQTLFIQRIAVTGEPGRPLSIRLGVSPL